MVESNLSTDARTVVGYSESTGIILYGGFGVIGVILGYFLPRIVAWILKLSWVPFRGPLELINKFDGPWLQLGLVLLGLIAGLVIASIAIKESLIVTLTDQEVLLDKNGHKMRFERSEIQTVFLDGKYLVILGMSGLELAREKRDESTKQLAIELEQTFKKHGYVWSSEGDPFKNEFQRWVLDIPDISLAANALMRAREKAKNKKDYEDVRELSNELAKLGYVVRDEDARQYYRQVKW